MPVFSLLLPTRASPNYFFKHFPPASLDSAALAQTLSAPPALYTGYGHGCGDIYGRGKNNKRYKAQEEAVLTCETEYVQGYKHTLLFDNRKTAESSSVHYCPLLLTPEMAVSKGQVGLATS